MIDTIPTLFCNRSHNYRKIKAYILNVFRRVQSCYNCLHNKLIQKAWPFTNSVVYQDYYHVMFAQTINLFSLLYIVIIILSRKFGLYIYSRVCINSSLISKELGWSAIIVNICKSNFSSMSCS